MLLVLVQELFSVADLFAWADGRWPLWPNLNFAVA